MSKTSSPSLIAAEKWTRESALPLWLDTGVDWKQGGFFEALGTDGQPLAQNRRAMVQARQIYACRLSLELGWFNEAKTREAARLGIDYLMQKFSLPSGAFIHSVTNDGVAANTTLDLYAQAFGLFGLAQAYSIEKESSERQGGLKVRAEALVAYLERERRLPEGGFWELQDGRRALEANPHMHLFEAFLAWMEVDPDPMWRKLASEILELCLDKFIDRESGTLAEHFSDGWTPIRIDGRFVVEPGHQFEWAWLIGRYEKFAKVDVSAARERLFVVSEGAGICESPRVVYDELWNDFEPKMKSARFWPQCERIKAATQFVVPGHPLKETAESAMEEATANLLTYFGTKTPGLWHDKLEEDGSFKSEPARASALYHIFGAISEAYRLTK